MTTDLAKLHLYNLYLEIKKLHGHHVKFSAEICDSVHDMSSELISANELHNQVVTKSREYLSCKRDKDTTPPAPNPAPNPAPTPSSPSPPAPSLPSLPRLTYSEALKSSPPVNGPARKSIPSLLSINVSPPRMMSKGKFQFQSNNIRNDNNNNNIRNGNENNNNNNNGNNNANSPSIT